MSEPFRWSAEHEEFRGVLRKLTETRAPLACAPSPVSADPGERELWRSWSEELGLLGLAVPEEYGGAGFSRLELAIAAEELGRAVVGGPLFASAVLATEALLGTGPDPVAAEVLPALAAGGTTAALAVAEIRWDPDAIRTSAEGGRLTGDKPAVLAAEEADVLVVAAREDAGVSLFLVDAGADGLTITPCAVLDPSRPMARVTLRDTPARRVGAPGEGWAAVERALEAGAVFLAAEQVGGSQALLDAAVEHASTRVQFGQPIGRFQGVKHRLADMAVRTELARSAAVWAAWQRQGTDAARLGAAVARAHCSESYVDTALDAIQVHGGMAITWEHHAHRYLRRARANLSVLPDPAAQRRFLETVIGTGEMTPPPHESRGSQPHPRRPERYPFDATTSVNSGEAVKSWLEEHLPEPWRRAALAGDRHALARISRDEPTTTAWYRTLGEAGLATPGWPVEHGGLGLPADAAAVVNDELARLCAGRPMADFVGIALAGPTIIEWGDSAQRQRFLRPLALGEHRWCQLFSEPGAGSDLASLTTRATRRDDGSWVVDGQKVWSSFSDTSDFGLLLARTDQSQPKHRGITYFLLDMRTPGITVRPLRQLNGESEFGEVFLDGVVVPDTDRLGPEGGGWAVTMTTLMQERSGLSGRPGVGPGRADALAVRAKETGAWADPVLRDRVLTAFVAERVLQMTTVRAFADLGRREPGAEGSIRKLAHGALDTTLGRLATEVEPGGAIAWDESDVDAEAAASAFLSGKILSIAGGTTEIQRNIIGERVLGLPRDRDPYAEVAFSERPHG